MYGFIVILVRLDDVESHMEIVAVCFQIVELVRCCRYDVVDDGNTGDWYDRPKKLYSVKLVVVDKSNQRR